MLHDMDEIENIEKMRALELIIHTMKNFDITIDDLTESMRIIDYSSAENGHISNGRNKYLFNL